MVSTAPPARMSAPLPRMSTSTAKMSTGEEVRMWMSSSSVQLPKLTVAGKFLSNVYL